MNEARNDRTFYGLQALRAIAALMVVLVHSIYLWHTRVLGEANPQYWMGGASGVDIFFVISGFVMTITLPGIAGFENRARVFLWRRITRIVPLYWLATTLKVALLLATPALALHPHLRLWNVVGSYLFVPTINPDGLVVPVIVQGWTLNFEMFFYLVFTASLLPGYSPVPLLTSILSIIAALGLLHSFSTPAFLSLISPMLIEFLFGISIARSVQTGKVPGRWSSAALALAGWVAILTIFPHLPADSDQVQKWRFAIWGIPAACIVLGTVGLESIFAVRLPRWVVVAGNASYAVYLVQTFVLPVVGIIAARMSLQGEPALAFIIAMGMSLSFLAGDLVHRFIELPILAKLKRLNVPGVSTVPAAVVER
jgi:peptidoglycan/LPS O-acetylase OafA/YrhL